MALSSDADEFLLRLYLLDTLDRWPRWKVMITASSITEHLVLEGRTTILHQR